jgi:hypothetical protein
MNSIEYANHAGAEGLRALAKQAGLDLEEVVEMAQRGQLHLAIGKANSPAGRARARAETRRLEQLHGITPTDNTIERTTMTGRLALAITMGMRR